MDDFLFHIHCGMLAFVGFQVLDLVVTYGPARMTDEERTAARDTVREAVALIAADFADHRSLPPTSPDATERVRLPSHGASAHQRGGGHRRGPGARTGPGGRGRRPREAHQGQRRPTEPTTPPARRVEEDG